MTRHSPTHTFAALSLTVALFAGCSSDDSADTTPTTSSTTIDDGTTSSTTETSPTTTRDDPAPDQTPIPGDDQQVHDPAIPDDHHTNPDVPDHFQVGDGFATLARDSAPERIAEIWAYEYHLANAGQSSAQWFDRMRPWSSAEVIAELESFNYTAPRSDVEVLAGLVTAEGHSTWHITGQTLDCTGGTCQPGYAFAMAITVTDGLVTGFEYR